MQMGFEGFCGQALPMGNQHLLLSLDQGIEHLDPLKPYLLCSHQDENGLKLSYCNGAQVK